MWLNTIRTAQNLQKRGIQARQVIGFMGGNNDHLFSSILASLCLACPICPLHPLLSKDELVCILMKTKPSVIFCDVSAYDHLNQALKALTFNVKVFTFGGMIDVLEPVECLQMETGIENHFV